MQHRSCHAQAARTARAVPEPAASRHRQAHRMPDVAPPVTQVAVRHVPPARRRGGDIRVRLGPRTGGATSGFFGVLTLAPGEFVSEHYHPYSEEFLYAIRGSATVRLDGTDLIVL